MRAAEIPRAPARSARWWAIADLAVGSLSLAVGGACSLIGVLAFAADRAGRVLHPDAMFLPLLVGIVPLSAGALLLVAAAAMRQSSPRRWAIQCGAIVASIVLAVSVGFVIR